MLLRSYIKDKNIQVSLNVYIFNVIYFLREHVIVHDCFIKSCFKVKLVKVLIN